uniref:Uncharacterized protein n=1 Tax=uncultured Desulfobacterium sp. TaxID=201089 RepID=E1YI25_9BACT|nr:unknown protein [uncultured Desulfobacterium sp.]
MGRLVKKNRAAKVILNFWQPGYSFFENPWLPVLPFFYKRSI